MGDLTGGPVSEEFALGKLPVVTRTAVVFFTP